MDSSSADNSTMSTPAIMATPSVESARTTEQYNEKVAGHFLTTLAFIYNSLRDEGWSAADLDAVANRAIEDAIIHLLENEGSSVPLDWLTFWATRNFGEALSWSTKSIRDREPTVRTGPCVLARLTCLGYRPGRQLEPLQELVAEMTGVTVNLKRTPLVVAPRVLPPQPVSSTSQPAPASPPAPRGPLAEALDGLFRAEFKDHPSFQAKNGITRALPPFSVPLPKELNLKTDIFDGDKDIMHVNLLPFELRVCKETHSIRLQLSPSTLDREWYPTSTLDNCGFVVDKMVMAYGWLCTWVIDMHDAKRVLPVYEHLRDYGCRPFHHKAWDMEGVKSRYNEWRVDWENYIQVIGPSGAETAIRRPAFMEAASFRELLIRIDRDPPERSVMDELAKTLSIWVSDELPSVKDIREAVACVGTVVLEHVAKLGVNVQTYGQPSDSEKIVGKWVTDTLNDLEGLASGLYVKPNAYIWSLINARE